MTAGSLHRVLQQLGLVGRPSNNDNVTTTTIMTTSKVQQQSTQQQLPQLPMSTAQPIGRCTIRLPTAHHHNSIFNDEPQMTKLPFHCTQFAPLKMPKPL
eukprot:4408154-Amphidinium_carterae.1